MKWIVTSAWPYAHGTPHLGNIVSSLLSADVFARFLKLNGHEVIYVTGSDEHGTPIEVKALKAGVSPVELTNKVHAEILEILKGFNISPDNYTRTHNRIHIEFVQETFKKIYKNGYIFTKREKVFYCPKDKIYLPDRFVIGTCPYCGYENARGDQCENCGRLLTPLELINPRCAICGEKPIIKEKRHYYIDLPKFEKRLYEWISNSETLTDNARNFSLNMLKNGLKPRSITRDNKWGIPAPFPSARHLTIYVWFDAVLGYVSAVKEYYIKKNGDSEKWKEWWWNNETHVAFFIGKDNIPFHTIIFPALLMGTHDPYTFNFHIGSTEWLTYEGQKFSKSKGIGIWGEEAIRLLPADYWRYTLMYIRPETKDTNFTWKILEYAVNEELNNQLGNLVHRVLTLIDRYQDGEILSPSSLTEEEKKLNILIREKKKTIEKLYYQMRFQKALNEIMKIVREMNSLINLEKPWELYEKDKEKLKGHLYTLAKTMKDVAIMLYPIIPDSSMKILKYLNCDRCLSWREINREIPSNTRIRRDYKPLFHKISIEDTKKKLMEMRGVKNEVDLDYLSKIDIRIGEIRKAEKKKGSRKILRLIIDVGGREVKVLAGLAEFYDPEELIGKKVVVVTNIKKKKIIDEYSEGMLLAGVDDRGNVSLLVPDRDIKSGAEVK